MAERDRSTSTSQPLPTFHGKVYVAKKVRKTSDLPGSMTNASAAQRRYIEPEQHAQPTLGKEKRYVCAVLVCAVVMALHRRCRLVMPFPSKPKAKKFVQKRISSGGDELQNQVDAGWVNVSVRFVGLLVLAHTMGRCPYEVIVSAFQQYDTRSIAAQVNLSLMAVTDLIHFAKKILAGTPGIHTLKLECFPK